MIFINASYKDEIIMINKKKPLYIEMPTHSKKPNMLVYKGVRDSVGNMNWINPKELDKFLVPIDLNLLDFLPKGFDIGATKYLNFFEKKVNRKAVDSLYYNTPTLLESKDDLVGEYSFCSQCGIQPSEIQTIKSKQFFNTLISTKEFEERLRYLFKIRKQKLINIYVENLDRDLWISDSLVVEELQNYNIPLTQIRTEEYTLRKGNLSVNKERRVLDTIGYKDKKLILNKFIEFKNQKLTNVKNKNKFINTLKNFYKIKLIKNLKNTDSIRKLELDQETVKEYKKLLKERKRIILQSYGFVQSELGWINIDKGVLPKKWSYQKINIALRNDIKFDNIYAYLLFKNTKSIVKLKNVGNKLFHLNYEVENKIPIVKNSKINIVVVAYKNERLFFKSKIIKINSSKPHNDFNISLKRSSFQKFKNSLVGFKDNDESNNLIKDLKLSSKIEKVENMNSMLLKLAFPACFNE